MSFFSNFQSDRCPGTITGNPLNGLCEKVCIRAQKIFDACIKQVQLENYVITLGNFPEGTTYPVTFVSARSSADTTTTSNISIDRLTDKPGCARVQCTVGIPIDIVYTDANGTEGVVTGMINYSQDVLLFVPAPSIMPYQAVAQASAVCAEGTFAEDGSSITVNVCLTIILKIAIDVELLIPSYGYCAIPPAQDYSQEVCAGFFELPLYPQGGKCACK